MTSFSQHQMSQLKPSNLDILDALARYRFLTTSQIISLGIASYPSSLSRTLRNFDAFRKPLVTRSRFSEVVAGRSGRLAKEDLLTLTPKGAELLLAAQPDRNDMIRFSRSKGISARDYEHTRETVDFHILLDQFADDHDCSVDCFHTYHDHTGANSGHKAAKGIDLLRRQTTFEVTDQGERWRFSADAVFHLTDPAGKGHLFAVEIQRGMDTKRLCDKLRTHYIPALAEGVISEAYGVNHNATILIVCENQSLLENTIKRLADDPEFTHFHKCFAFHTITGLRGEPQGNPTSRAFVLDWQFLGGKVGTVF